MNKELSKLRKKVGECKRCKLWKYRDKLAFAEGPENAEIY